MKTTKVLGLLLICLAAAYFVYPIQTGQFFDQVTTKGHRADCDVLINRQLGNPYIGSVSCSSGEACDGISSMDFIGDYRGTLEMSLAGNTKSFDYTVGVGLPGMPATTHKLVSMCVKDGSYNGVMRLKDGQGNILDSESFAVAVSP